MKSNHYIDNETLSLLIGDFYEAGIHPEYWPAALENLCRVIGADSAGLFIQDFSTNHISSMYVWGISQTVLEKYPQFSHRDPAFPIMQSKPAGIACNIFSLPEIMRTDPEYCRELLEPAGIAYQAGINIYNDSEWVVGLAFNRNSSKVIFDESSFYIIKYLWPHMQRAIRIQKEIFQLKLNLDVLKLSVDSVQYGIILTDEAGEIFHINQVAKECFNDIHDVAIVGNKLSLTTCDRHENFNKFIDDLLSDESKEMRGMPISGIKSQYRIQANKLAYSTASEYINNGLSHPRIIFTLFKDEFIRQEPDYMAIKTTYELSVSEIEIVQAISMGEKLKQIALNRRVSINTVKTQLQCIYQKTGVNRQSDLIRLLYDYQ